MNDQELRKLLRQIHTEIQQTKPKDEKGRKLLQELEEDLQKLLDRSDKAPIKPQKPMTNRLQAAIDHFELTHPTLTTALSDLMTALSNAGI
jgi:arginyl-tRNA synthetase